MLKIVVIPHKALTAKSARINKIDNRIRRLVADMEETLIHQKDPEGVGLAAPQVGVNLDLFIIKTSKKTPTEVYINPRIVSEQETVLKPSKSTSKMEGCLSIPRIWSPLRRARDITLEWMDLEGTMHTQEFKGFKSTIIQHEVDHLNGILFTMRCLEQGVDIYEERGDRLDKVKII